MRACSIDECPSAVVARGFCRKHYSRWKRTGDAATARPKLPNNAYSSCTIEGCDKPHVTKGVCEMHRWRLRQHGDVGPAEQVMPHRSSAVRGPCVIEGCELPAKSRAGHCKRHYERIRRTGHPGPVGLMVRESGTGHVTEDGYIRLTLPGGRRVLEHVHVMEQHLGRRLVPGENVHHRFGVRDDNAIENLELWLVTQPSGQRVSDLIAYVAKYHPEEVRAALAQRR